MKFLSSELRRDISAIGSFVYTGHGVSLYLDEAFAQSCGYLGKWANNAEAFHRQSEMRCKMHGIARRAAAERGGTTEIHIQGYSNDTSSSPPQKIYETALPDVRIQRDDG